MRLLRLRQHVDAGRFLVGGLEVQAAADEVVLHHQHRIDDLTGTGHPHLVTSLALRRGDGHLVVAEDLGDGHSLTTVTGVGRGGVGVDIADLAQIDTRILQTQLQRTGRTRHVGCRDMVAVAGEAPAHNLCQYLRTTGLGVLVALHDQRGSTTTGNQSVTVLVKRTAGLRRLILTHGERHQTVERGDAEHIGLLRTTTDDAVLQAVLDQQIAQT